MQQRLLTIAKKRKRPFPSESRLPRVQHLCSRFQTVQASTQINSAHPHSTHYTTEFSLHGPPAENHATYRVMNEEGEILVSDYSEENLDREQLLNMYRNMVLGNTFDNIFYDAQRQGRISFYMTNFGEEAAQVGSTEGLNHDDLCFLQYRELGVFIHRGVPLQQLSDCNYSNVGDPNCGKQMPIHYGSKEHHLVTISSTLATQMPQAAGAAYAYKREKKGRCVACFFGDGAASEGDAFVAFSFSSTLKAPVVWLCRNNGYAISTPLKDQYAGDGLVARGLALGMGAIRVDGNDILAVRDSVRAARNHAVENNMPVMVELMTYRGGHHSTSDDATRYRQPEEIMHWARVDNPIIRFQKLLFNLEYLTKEEDDAMRKEIRSLVLTSFREAESKKKPDIAKMFDDVFSDKPWNLQEQQDHLFAHLRKYPHDYNTEEYSR